MLGGKSREKIQTTPVSYSLAGDGSDKDMLTEPEQYAQAALTAVSEGCCDAIKVIPSQWIATATEPAKPQRFTDKLLHPLRPYGSPFAMQSARRGYHRRNARLTDTTGDSVLP